MQKATHGGSLHLACRSFHKLKETVCQSALMVVVMMGWSKKCQVILVVFQKYSPLANQENLGGFVANGGLHATSSGAYLCLILLQVSSLFVWHNCLLRSQTLPILHDIVNWSGISSDFSSWYKIMNNLIFSTWVSFLHQVIRSSSLTRQRQHVIFMGENLDTL